jgi:phosphatidylinositol alpha-1,6-mannosyltransferase
MDILVITWNFPPRRGGMEQLLASLCNGLSKNHRLFVITSYAGSSYERETGIFRPRWPGLFAFFSYALCKGALLLRCQRDISVVFGGSVLVTPIILILTRIFRRRAIVQAHGLDVVYSRSIYQFFCVRWLKFCDRVIANSSYTAALVQQKGAAPARITVIPPGVDLEAFGRPVNAEATKKEFGLEGKQIILFVGRLARRKGVKEFIENSLPKIIRGLPDACFVVVGDNPKQSLTDRDDVLSEIKGAIAETKMQDHVYLLGALEDHKVIKLYHACEVVILPAVAVAGDVEGFGIVLLEAAAAGKPVVSTRIGGIGDAIEHKASGILVEPEDYRSMSQSIIDLLSDHKVRSEIGEYAQKRVKETFCWDLIIPRYEKAFL